MNSSSSSDELNNKAISGDRSAANNGQAGAATTTSLTTSPTTQANNLSNEKRISPSSSNPSPSLAVQTDIDGGARVLHVQKGRENMSENLSSADAHPQQQKHHHPYIQTASSSPPQPAQSLERPRGVKISSRPLNNNNNSNNKKNGNGASTTSTTKKLYTIDDVRFDIGDAKSAANITNNMRTFISHIRTSLKYGEYRQEVADAIEKEKFEEGL